MLRAAGFIFVRPVILIFIRKHGNADGFNVITVKDAIIIDIHAQRKGKIVIALDFDVNHQTGLAAIGQKYFDKLVGVTSPCLRIASNLFKFFIHEFISTRPVDALMDTREKESHKIMDEILIGNSVAGKSFWAKCIAYTAISVY